LFASAFVDLPIIAEAFQARHRCGSDSRV